MLTSTPRLQTPLRAELGPRTATLLEKLDLHTVEDLLRHYPRRWAERAELTPLSELREGEQATVVAEVVATTARPMRARRGQLMTARVTDGHDELRLTFFLAHAGQVKHHESALRPGRRALFAGRVERYGAELQLTHPEYELFEDDEDEDLARSRQDQLVAVYPATGSLPSWKIAKSLGVVLDTLDDEAVPDPLPADVLAARSLPALLPALAAVHRPTSRAQGQRGMHRFRYEEALVLQLALARRRAARAHQAATARPPRADGLLARFDAALPFALTEGQRSVGEVLAAELSGTSPMNRLLQGEVGSGKTLVALRAMLQVVDAGGQAALLAPTEVLAAQHQRSLAAVLGDLGAGGTIHAADGATRIALLTGSLGAAARRTALLDITAGQAGLVVGTHALLSEGVDFADLGLVVVDEQHRFGVEQRDALRARSGAVPHALVMTATPIPRTVAMTVFGDLEVSTLTELPAGRATTTTAVVPTGRPAWVERCWARVREEVQAGHQAFVVCPRIGGEDAGQVTGQVAVPVTGGAGGTGGSGDGDEDGRAAGAVEVLEALRTQPATADLRLALLHGRLPAEEKDAVMRAFAAGDVDVLVATTVVEVGVDVPNATVMVVVDADRFGLSQLHQLRGRVGRGGHPGLCLLLSGTDDPERQQRLEEVAATADGFAVARIDLESRREGDVLGAAQSGRRSSLRLLRVTRDEEVIAAAREDATALVAADPDLSEHPLLARALAALDAEREAYLERG